ncbi:MAG: RES family NAD+ phosphorylase [Candidatus Omnitrophica bacterium]|nr:RES family NAD+ phosphorylase [Candidatus Omnitrophota bacterium]
MRTSTFRMVRTGYVESAFDGEGAGLNGERWSSVGTPMVYAAGTLSLATLEPLVHLKNLETIFHRYLVIPVEFEERLVDPMVPKKLPKGWNSPEPISETQILGESNYPINPRHPDFKKISIGKLFGFNPDSRLGGNR